MPQKRGKLSLLHCKTIGSFGFGSGRQSLLIVYIVSLLTEGFAGVDGDRSFIRSCEA